MYEVGTYVKLKWPIDTETKAGQVGVVERVETLVNPLRKKAMWLGSGYSVQDAEFYKYKLSSVPFFEVDEFDIEPATDADIMAYKLTH